MTLSRRLSLLKTTSCPVEMKKVFLQSGFSISCSKKTVWIYSLWIKCLCGIREFLRFLRKQCVNQLFEFGVWYVFVSANANIAQRVKTCYKNKIDYRESSGGFCRIMQGWKHSKISIEPLLHSNTTTIGTQKRLYRIITVDVLQCKSGSFATLTGLFRYAVCYVWNLITA